jgi:hypothetical protein
MYDDQSELVIEDFEGITTMSNLNIMYRITMVRKNGDNFYTVYSLKDRKLAYIKIIFRPETGTGFYVTDKIESQSGATDGKLEFVLEQDRPENILQID